jgi:hypothetical protein
MSAAERIDKFFEDASRFTASKNAAKITSEAKKLAVWLQKHQSESIPEGSKAKLMSTVEVYYRYGKMVPELADAARNLIDDLLKLPEGKLVSAKGKNKALRWLGSSSAVGPESSEDCDNADGETSDSPRRWIVAEIVSEKKRQLTLMDADGGLGDLLENVIVGDVALFNKIKAQFDLDGTVYVNVSGVHVLRAISEDGTTL